MLQGNRLHVLIVADQGTLVDLTEALAAWSAQAGCGILTASDSTQALQHAEHHDLAVVLIKNDTPGLDTERLISALRSQTRSADVPLLRQGAAPAGQSDAAFAAALDYLPETVTPAMLIARLNGLLAWARKAKALEAELQTLQEQIGQSLAEPRETQALLRQHRARDDFLSVLGHELRNPLSAITSAASVLGFPGVPEDKAQRARLIIQRQSQNLSRIVDDLLDLSRVLSGRIRLDKQALELGKLVEACIEALKAGGRCEGYNVRTDLAAVWADADAMRIEQAIGNLLDNALKFTPVGGDIDISLQAQDPFAVLTVRDSGIGMAAELLPQVFEAFVQGPHTLDRSQGGLGTGLALVQQLVLLHGGSISADSAGLGLGSSFEIRLPLTAPTVQPDWRQVAAVPCKPRRILLIEDNADGREMMTAMLQASGHSVFAAADGQSGVALALNHGADIALIDIGLPGASGYEVATLLRKSSVTRHIRLIALTGYGQPADQKRALKAGFDLHLVKPVSAESLNDAIRLCASLLI